ncbi:MAG: DUF1501 domain-containing protein [Saprospiraceae bacterium]
MKRRNFLKLSAPMSIAPLMVGGIPVQSFATPRMLAMDCEGVEDRVLVIIQLGGGNDGLNMVVPKEQYDTYAQLRPTLGIAESTLIDLDNSLALENQVKLHPALTEVKDLYDSGKVNLIQSVGYESPNLSHFKSTDLWMSGGDGTPDNFNLQTGWMGRYLSARYPGIPGNPSGLFLDPLGIQLGDSKPSLGFHSGEMYNPAVNLSGQDASNFDNLISEIGGAPLSELPASEYGDELDFIMNIENSVSNYSQRITSVYNAGSNAVSYPVENDLADQLKTVARFLSGGSTTKIFLVKLHGFDTHVDQVLDGDPTMGLHTELLTQFSKAIKAFQDDLDAQNLSNKVLTISFSEFGRKAEENGALGSDHGTIAPMLLFGTAVEPGMTGTNVDLSDLDNGQLQNHQHDYRQVFTTLLQDWLGANDSIITSTHFDSYLSGKLPFINSDNLVDPSCYGVPLPVELSYFKAKAIDNKEVLLTWETLSEENTAYFEIERSADGQNFERVFQLAAAGDSSKITNYKKIDLEPLSGVSYYRLKTIDFDESFEYAAIVSVEIRPTALEAIRLYPNPAIYDFQLTFMSEKTGLLDVRIVNMSGQVLRQRRLSVKGGFNKFAFPVDRLVAGNYVVEMTSGDLHVEERRQIVKVEE